MIVAIGIDSVEIERFADWANHPEENLKKIYSDKEIKYCLQNEKTSAERFAVRFAAKEAFFKALSHIVPDHEIPFLTVCKNVSTQQEKNGNPNLAINWDFISGDYGKNAERNLNTLISLTHTANTATALIIIENR